MSLPTGTITFLFTDIEGSSRLWEQHPEAMGPVLAEHDARLQAAVAENGGRVVKMRGDGLHAVFSSVKDAVEAAVAGQRALLSASWDQAIGQLPVRMGIHTGKAELRDGDYYGPVVNRAARLQDAGHGGQVLLSETAADLVRGRLGEGIALLDLGAYRIKDIPEPQHVFQLVAAGLRRDFPPLRTAGHLLSNLPPRVTSFIGRERELSETGRLLEQARLVTLTGPGGTGKTRLALQTAAHARGDYRDGAWLVELAPLSEETMVLPAVAGVFSLRPSPGQSLKAVVADFLRGKEMLLLLDNCEHLIEACAVLASEYLEVAPRLKILATSREPLRVTGEMELRVPSLALPAAPQINAETIQTSEAVQLLVERARAVQPDFQLTDDNAAAVAEICRRLDGIPLAIELAAARLRLFSPGQVAERLTDRFRLLTGGGRTALPRHRTLRALIDWSYDLLSAEEQELFRRLSVFTRGWSFEAAEAIGEGLDALEIMELLVSKSLIQVEDEATVSRYRYLETIRQYAREQMLAAGEEEETRDRHFAYFAQLATEAEGQMDGRRTEEVTAKLLSEADNFRQAIEWGLGRDVVVAVDLLVAATHFWFWTQTGPLVAKMGSAFDEIRRWLQSATNQLERLPTGAQVAERRQQTWARIKLVAGLMSFQMDEFEKAKIYSSEAADLARAQNDKRTLMRALGVLLISSVPTSVQQFADDEETYAAAEACLVLAQESNNDFYKNLALNVMAGIQLARGNEELADSLLLDAGKGSPFASAVSQFSGGIIVAHYAKAATKALPLFQESHRRFQETGHTFFIATSGSEIAHIQRRIGDLGPAEAAYRETIVLFQWLGHRPAVAQQLECFAFIARARKRPERAARLLGAAEALRIDAGSELLPYERQEYEQELALLRREMDEQTFAMAWSNGKAMNMDEAIAYALEID